MRTLRHKRQRSPLPPSPPPSQWAGAAARRALLRLVVVATRACGRLHSCDERHERGVPGCLPTSMRVVAVAVRTEFINPLPGRQ